jgi:hypothetical protein
VSRHLAGKLSELGHLLVQIRLICIQATAKHHDGYEKITVNLTEIIEDLEKHLRESRSIMMSESVENVVQ